MAAIKMTDKDAWVGAASVLAFIAERLQSSARFQRLQKNFDAIEAGWQYLDLSTLDERERDDLRQVVSVIVADVERGGPDAFGGPIHFPGFLERLREFEALVAK
jgi:hypothetical protein